MADTENEQQAETSKFTEQQEPTGNDTQKEAVISQTNQEDEPITLDNKNKQIINRISKAVTRSDKISNKLTRNIRIATNTFKRSKRGQQEVFADLIKEYSANVKEVTEMLSEIHKSDNPEEIIKEIFNRNGNPFVSVTDLTETSEYILNFAKMINTGNIDFTKVGLNTNKQLIRLSSGIKDISVALKNKTNKDNKSSKPVRYSQRKSISSKNNSSTNKEAEEKLKELEKKLNIEIEKVKHIEEANKKAKQDLKDNGHVVKNFTDGAKNITRDVSSTIGASAIPIIKTVAKKAFILGAAANVGASAVGLNKGKQHNALNNVHFDSIHIGSHTINDITMDFTQMYAYGRSINAFMQNRAANRIKKLILNDDMVSHKLLNNLSRTKYARTLRGKLALRSIAQQIILGNTDKTVKMMMLFESKLPRNDRIKFNYEIREIAKNQNNIAKGQDLVKKVIKEPEVKVQEPKKSRGRNRNTKTRNINPKELASRTNKLALSSGYDTSKGYFANRAAYIANSTSFGKYSKCGKIFGAIRKALPLVGVGFLAADVLNYFNTDCRSVIENFKKNPRSFDRTGKILTDSNPNSGTICNIIAKNMEYVRSSWIRNIGLNTALLILSPIGVIMPLTVLGGIATQLIFAWKDRVNLGFSFEDADFTNVWSFISNEELLKYTDNDNAIVVELKGELALTEHNREAIENVGEFENISSSIESDTNSFNGYDFSFYNAVDITTKEGYIQHRQEEQALVILLLSFVTGKIADYSLTLFRDTYSSYLRIKARELGISFDENRVLFQSDDKHYAMDVLRTKYKLGNVYGIRPNLFVGLDSYKVPNKLYKLILKDQSTFFENSNANDFSLLLLDIRVINLVGALWKQQNEYQKLVKFTDMKKDFYNSSNFIRYVLNDYYNVYSGVENGLPPNKIPMIARLNKFSVDNVRTILRHHTLLLLILKIPYIKNRSSNAILYAMDEYLNILRTSFAIFDSVDNFDTIVNEVNEKNENDALYKKYFQMYNNKDNDTILKFNDVISVQLSNKGVDTTTVIADKDVSTISYNQNDIIDSFIKMNAVSELTKSNLNATLKDKESQNDYLSQVNDNKGIKASLLATELFSHGLNRSQVNVLVPRLFRTSYVDPTDVNKHTSLNDSFNNAEEFYKYMSSMLNALFKTGGTRLSNILDQQDEMQLHYTANKFFENIDDIDDRFDNISGAAHRDFNNAIDTASNYVTDTINKDEQGIISAYDNVSGAVKTSGSYDVIYNTLIESGAVSEAGAVGILSNIKAESNANPFAYNMDGTSPSFGIAQWHLDRIDKVADFIVNNATSNEARKFGIQLQQAQRTFKETNMMGKLVAPTNNTIKNEILSLETKYLISEIAGHSSNLATALKGDNYATASMAFTKIFERPANADIQAIKRVEYIKDFVDDKGVVDVDKIQKAIASTSSSESNINNVPKVEAVSTSQSVVNVPQSQQYTVLGTEGLEALFFDKVEDLENLEDYT